MHAVYYRAADGSEPVNDFIDRLDVKRQVALDNQIERLNMLTKELPHLPYPHSSQIEGELRELRCHFGRELYRILYRRSRNLIVLLHVFRKDRGKIARRISTSRRRAGWTSRRAWMLGDAVPHVRPDEMPLDRRDSCINSPYQNW
jgi:phage-related protein